MEDMTDHEFDTLLELIADMVENTKDPKETADKIRSMKKTKDK